MKKFIIGLLYFIALLVIAFLLFKDCNDPQVTSAEIDKLKAENKEYVIEGKRHVDEIIRLQSIIDSLEAIPPEIEKEIVYLQAGVDSSIAKDSSNAIAEYRKGLNLLEIRTESTPTLTLREIGIGALTFRETYGFRLKIPVLQETIFELKNLDTSNTKLLQIKDNIIRVDSLLAAGQDLIIDELDSFWRNRFIFYIGIGGNWNGLELAPGIQAGFGIRIWGNE